MKINSDDIDIEQVEKKCFDTKSARDDFQQFLRGKRKRMIRSFLVKYSFDYLVFFLFYFGITFLSGMISSVIPSQYLPDREKLNGSIEFPAPEDDSQTIKFQPELTSAMYEKSQEKKAIV